MNRVFLSIIAVFIVIAGLAVFQATRDTAADALLPSDLIAANKDMPRVHVGGRVADLPIEYTVEPMIRLTFSVVNPGPSKMDAGKTEVPKTIGGDVKPIRVIYNGLKPDMFNAGRDVIIDGEYKNGELLASQLLTQCPSKYEPALPGSKPEKK